MRILHLIVIVALVLAAAYVYRIKLDSTVQAERVAKVRAEIRRERDKIAALRAEWAKLDSPARIQVLAKRHLPLRPTVPSQIGGIENIPLRPAAPSAADSDDPIAAVIEEAEGELVTGSLPQPGDHR
jgi:cell division protein FtsL